MHTKFWVFYIDTFYAFFLFIQVIFSTFWYAPSVVVVVVVAVVVVVVIEVVIEVVIVVVVVVAVVVIIVIVVVVVVVSIEVVTIIVLILAVIIVIILWDVIFILIGTYFKLKKYIFLGYYIYSNRFYLTMVFKNRCWSRCHKLHIRRRDQNNRNSREKSYLK